MTRAANSVLTRLPSTGYRRADVAQDEPTHIEGPAKGVAKCIPKLTSAEFVEAKSWWRY